MVFSFKSSDKMQLISFICRNSSNKYLICISSSSCILHYTSSYLDVHNDLFYFYSHEPDHRLSFFYTLSEGMIMHFFRISKSLLTVPSSFPFLFVVFSLFSFDEWIDEQYKW